MSDEMEQDSGPIESAAPEAPVEASQPSAPAEPQQSSPWDAFKQIPQFAGKDDRAIAAGLYQAFQREQAATQALRQYQSILPVAQEYINHRPAFQKWLESQQAQPAQQAAPPQQKWWNPPEIKDSHRRYLVKDEAGRDVIAPNAPYDAQQSLTEWMNYRADFAQKFLSNPEEALGPMIAEMAQKQAREIVENTIQQKDRENFVTTFERENADWLYDSETGNVSVEGAAFHKYVEQARSWGIPPGESRAKFAADMVELDLWRSRQAGLAQPPQQPQAPAQPPAAPPAQPAPVQEDRARQNMDYLRREASRNPSRSAGTTNNDPRQPKPPRSFVQMLAEEAQQTGLFS